MSSILNWIWECIRPIVKWFLRKTTGMCELMRICYGAESRAIRIKECEYSLSRSRCNQIRYMVEFLNHLCEEERYYADEMGAGYVEEMVDTVLDVKQINRKLHYKFVRLFRDCVRMIWGYRQLVVIVERVRREHYDCDNLEHERKLQDLWTVLMPDVPLESRVSKQWQDIGFQGDDPKTDFRGMGMLGLENLLHFSSEYQGAASHVLSHSHHPTYGYAFAIVGINITSMAWTLLKDGDAKLFFYNTCKTPPTMKDFHKLYCYLFYEFDRFWIECKPKDIMEFSNIRNRFEVIIKGTLLDHSSVFRINFAVDTV